MGYDGAPCGWIVRKGLCEKATVKPRFGKRCVTRGAIFLSGRRASEKFQGSTIFSCRENGKILGV